MRKHHHLFRRATGLVLTCLLLFSCAALPSFAAGKAETFTPVLRFIASSDSHVRMENDKTFERIGMMLGQTYALSDSDETYQSLDALIMAGDLTNSGTKEEFDKFWTAVSGAKRDSTQFLGVVAKNHDGWNMSRKEMRSYYSELTGETPDFHKVINGYHFIGLSASEDDDAHYSNAQLSWLKTQLKAAVADTPDKPVFFIHHEHNRNTVYGSSTFDGWGIKFFKKILKDYPQVVDFSGHSHYPLNDPRSIWQGTYTAIGTGALYYSEFTIDDIRAYDPPDCEDTATYWIVEVNEKGDLHLRGMDVLADKQLCAYTLLNPADCANRAYTPLRQRAASRSPVFSDDAAITAEQTESGSLRVTVPIARSTDGTPVVLYRLTVRTAYGLIAETQWYLPHYYVAEGQEETIPFEVEGLAKGKYQLCVTAETAYGVQSKPVKGTVTLADGSDSAKFFFDTLLWSFRRCVELFKHVVIERLF